MYFIGCTNYLIFHSNWSWYHWYISINRDILMSIFAYGLKRTYSLNKNIALLGQNIYIICRYAYTYCIITFIKRIWGCVISFSWFYTHFGKFRVSLVSLLMRMIPSMDWFYLCFVYNPYTLIFPTNQWSLLINQMSTFSQNFCDCFVLIYCCSLRMN